MSASDFVTWAVLAVLNLAVASLALSARPRRTSHVLVALLVGANGLYGLVLAAQEAGYRLSSVSHHALALILNAPVFASFALIPLFFPRERLDGTRARLALHAGAIFVIVNWAAAGAHVWLGRDHSNGAGDPVFGPLAWLPFLAALGVGTLMLLQSYRQADGPGLRTQALFMLATFALKAASQASEVVRHLGRHPLAPGPPPATSWGVAAEALSALFVGPAVVAVVALVVVDRARALAGRRRGRPLREDALLLGVVVLGFAGAHPVFVAEIDYLVLRPLLLTYAILQHELVAVDLSRRRGVVATTVVAALTSIFLATMESMRRLAIPADAGIPLGFAVTVALGSILAWPFIRLLVAPAMAADRGRELYRAALDEALLAGETHATTNAAVLRTLRDRLRISEREHAVLEAQARAAGPHHRDGLPVGERFLGRYLVEARLGEGGFARAFLARDERLGRRVVLKVARWATPDETRRVLREARILAALSHPNILEVHDMDEVAGEVVLVLEHAAGGSLKARLAEGPLPLDEALAVVDDVLAALEAAHARGVVHRDVKPANVLLTAEGRAKLADFGIAHAREVAVTLTGLTFASPGAGSIAYMSPEQARGIAAGPKSDLYAVGALLHETLSGRPYLRLEGLTEFEARRAILEDEPELPLPGVPARVNAALALALAKDPADRPASTSEMRRLLSAG